MSHICSGFKSWYSHENNVYNERKRDIERNIYPTPPPPQKKKKKKKEEKSDTAILLPMTQI